MITVEFVMERETKNAIRFKEVVENDLTAPKIGTMYVPKSTLGAIGWGRDKTLKVTLEVG